VGRAPFGDTEKMSKFEVFNNINRGKFSIPSTMSSALKELLKGLLELNAEKRFAFKACEDSAWMAGVPWSHFGELKVIPPWTPNAIATNPTQNFISWDKLRIPNEKDAEVPALPLFL
jgi:hypothetical protein